MEAIKAVDEPTRPYGMESARSIVSQGAGPEFLDDLVGSLTRRAKAGVNVAVAPLVWRSTMRVDVIISTQSERIGIVCDQSDARKLFRRRSLLNGLFVDRMYLTSALDTVLDPESVARSIAACESLLFNETSKTRREGMRVTPIPVLPSARRPAANASKRRNESQKDGSATQVAAGYRAA